MSDEHTTISTVRGNSEFTPIEVKEGSDGFVLLQQGDMAIAIHPVATVEVVARASYSIAGAIWCLKGSTPGKRHTRPR